MAILAVLYYHSSSGLYLIRASTGSILKHIATAGPEFGQAVFADNMMLVPTKNNGLWAYR